jgi:hypothetical protein
MANQITHGDSVRQAVLRGVDRLAAAVKVTLVPGLALGLGLLAAACGGGSSPGGMLSSPTVVATPTPAPTPVPLSASETEQVNATIADATEAIVQGIIHQVSAQGHAGLAPVHSSAIESWARQADLSGLCTSGGAFFGGSGSFNDETGFVSGQGTLQLKQCGNRGGMVLDGSLMVQGVGTAPGNVSGTTTGNLSLYRVQPSGGLSLVSSSYGVLRNWSCRVAAGGANCS